MEAWGPASTAALTIFRTCDPTYETFQASGDTTPTLFCPCICRIARICWIGPERAVARSVLSCPICGLQQASLEVFGGTESAGVIPRNDGRGVLQFLGENLKDGQAVTGGTDEQPRIRV